MLTPGKNDSQSIMQSSQEGSSFSNIDQRSDRKSKHYQKYCGKRHKIENKRSKYSSKDIMQERFSIALPKNV